MPSPPQPKASPVQPSASPKPSSPSSSTPASKTPAKAEIRFPKADEILVSRVRVLESDPETGRRSSSDTFAVPRRMHPTDAGFDLEACQSMLLPSGQASRIPHNLAIALPAGYYGVIAPRSSTLHMKGLIVIPGTIDPDFRGELQTVVYNPSSRTVQILERERVSQLLIFPLIALHVTEIGPQNMPPGEGRGLDGWGSTGGFAPKK